MRVCLWNVCRYISRQNTYDMILDSSCNDLVILKATQIWYRMIFVWAHVPQLDIEFLDDHIAYNFHMKGKITWNVLKTSCYVAWHDIWPDKKTAHIHGGKTCNKQLGYSHTQRHIINCLIKYVLCVNAGVVNRQRT